MKIVKNSTFSEKIDRTFFLSHEWRSTIITLDSILLWSKPAKNIINCSSYLYTIK